MQGGVVTARTEGTTKGGPLSALLSNILLTDLDRNSNGAGSRFAATGTTVRVRGQSGGGRAGDAGYQGLPRGGLASARQYREERRGVAVRATFLGYSVTAHRETRLRIAPQ